MAALLLLLAVGCGDLSNAGDMLGAGGSAGSAEGGAGAGGGAVDGGDGAPTVDASLDGFSNNPVGSLAADPVRGPFGTLADAEGISDYVEAASLCYADRTACETASCGAFASCCPATGGCCSSVRDAALPSSIDFTSCAGLSLEACAADQGFAVTAFGTTSPLLIAGGLVPNGSATAEGGALVGAAIDLASRRVRVEVGLTPPVGCNAVCLQSAGVAFTQASEPDAFGGVDVGLLLSGSRDAVQLLIGNQVTATFDAGNAETGWALTVSPSGVVEVERDGVLVAREALNPTSLRASRLAVFGRNIEANETSAAVSRIAADVQLCDNPRRWRERAPLTVTVEGEIEPGLTMGREPSIATGPQGTVVAFEQDGAIFVGDAPSPSVVELDSTLPLIFPTAAFEAGGLGEPELFWLDGVLHVLYTAYDVNGVGTIGMAVVEGGVAQQNLEPVLPVPGDAVSLDSPTVVGGDELVLMVLRATLRSGATELRAYYSPDPNTGWARVLDGALEDLTRIEDPLSSIGSPSLILHNSAYHLYYARRTGTRWTVELATSDELLLWRPLGEVLEGSAQGFDSLGARGPDARSLLDRIELVYMGQDGVSFRLGRALRDAPSASAF